MIIFYLNIDKHSVDFDTLITISLTKTETCCIERKCSVVEVRIKETLGAGWCVRGGCREIASGANGERREEKIGCYSGDSVDAGRDVRPLVGR